MVDVEVRHRMKIKAKVSSEELVMRNSEARRADGEAMAQDVGPESPTHGMEVGRIVINDRTYILS